ncbi:MAG: AbrB/MazE/SpoVT family DNA-binding domain-containing protein [Chloroflexi bacterium]|nr:AbrB/MazE/SpoVT family DNA-binding domain-containing protein [Chloroflexota bacterium]
MTTTSMTTKGQIVIPADIRRKLNLKVGTRVNIEEKNGEIVLRPLTVEYLDKTAGILGTNGDLTRELLEERARERDKEDTQ